MHNFFLYSSIPNCLFYYFRKEVCWEKIQRFLGNLGDSINTCLEKESFIQTIQSKIDRTSGWNSFFCHIDCNKE